MKQRITQLEIILLLSTYNFRKMQRGVELFDVVLVHNIVDYWTELCIQVQAT